MTALAPCSSCSRHVRETDARCPFCGGAARGPRVDVVVSPGLSRAAIMLAGLAAVAACGKSTAPTPPDPPAPVPSFEPSASAPAYGAPIPVDTDAGASDAGAKPDARLPAPPYGLPPDVRRRMKSGSPID